jgi:hypothetical protein
MARYSEPLVPGLAPPVSVEKCMAAISHLSSFFATVMETLRGKANSFPSFFPVKFPDAISQPISELIRVTVHDLGGRHGDQTAWPLSNLAMAIWPTPEKMW